MRKLCYAIAMGWAFGCPCGGAVPVAAAQCALELVIAVDVSGSIDSQTYALQMRGYAAAFRDAEVQRAIAATGPGGIAVTLFQWGSTEEQHQTIGWRRVHDPLSAESLAAAIEAAPRRFSQTGTAIGAALAYATGLFEQGGFRCRRRVIDISGDGRSNVGPEPSGMRDAVVLIGVTINGLPITDTDEELDSYYLENVIGGNGAFVMTAESYTDIATTIRGKLLRELSPQISREPGGHGPGMAAEARAAILPRRW